MDEIESCPDKWHRWKIETGVKVNLTSAADFLKANMDNVVFVTNTTTGCNCVLKSIPLNPGDAILINSYTYGAIKNTAFSAAERWGAEVLVLKIPLEVKSVSEIIEMHRTFLQENSNVKVIVLDYIASGTAMLYPVKEITEVCKQHGVLVLIDGAHTPGQLPVNLEELGNIGVDFYVGNFHKWAFTPRGCAVLWCHPKHHHRIRPVVTSHKYKTLKIQEDFFTQGTADLTPFLCVTKTIDFYNETLGGYDEIFMYSHSLLDKATAMLCEAWGTAMFPIPKEMQAPFMRVVRLPDIKRFPVAQPKDQDAISSMMPLMTYLNDKYQITAMVLGLYGKPWVRLSGSVHNTMEDYEKLRDAILHIQRET